MNAKQEAEKRYAAARAAADALADASGGVEPRVLVVLGSGLEGVVGETEVTSTIDFAEVPGLPASDGGRSCRAFRVRSRRGDACAHHAGSYPPVRGASARAARTLRSRRETARCRHVRRDQRSWRRESRLHAGRHRDARRPHQHDVHQPAARAQRRRVRTAFSRHGRRLRHPSYANWRGSWQQNSESPSTRACTRGCVGRHSRRPPRSACCAPSAPTSSACRRCPR